jgi:hypothetical protein
MAGQAKFGAVNYVDGRPIYTDDQGNEIDEQSWYKANDAFHPMSGLGGAYAGYQGGPLPGQPPPQQQDAGGITWEDGKPTYADNAGNTISEQQWYQAKGAFHPMSGLGGEYASYQGGPLPGAPQPETFPAKDSYYGERRRELANYGAASDPQRQGDNRPAQRWEPQGGIKSAAPTPQRQWGNRPAQRWQPQGGTVTPQPQQRGWGQRPAQRGQPQGGIVGTGQQQQGGGEQRADSMKKPQPVFGQPNKMGA